MKVVLDKQPTKYLRKLDISEYKRIDEALEKLSLEPPEGDITKLQGEEKAYRLRVGDRRILYKVKVRDTSDGNTENYIAIYKIASRGQVYKHTRRKK
jgi:mRNA-degrading endonuclease RelE of RelBE toxin-antitoxin system